MIGILLMFAFGLLVGRRLGLSEETSTFLNRLTFWVVVLLLFVLGVNIGQNASVFARLPDLGAVSLFISWSSILGSSLVALLIYRLSQQRVE
jgi:hypothetical protein